MACEQFQKLDTCLIDTRYEFNEDMWYLFAPNNKCATRHPSHFYKVTLANYVGKLGRVSKINLILYLKLRAVHKICKNWQVVQVGSTNFGSYLIKDQLTYIFKT